MLMINLISTAMTPPRLCNYMGNFQAYNEEHRVWPYPTFSENTRWTKEKDRQTCAVDIQGKYPTLSVKKRIGYKFFTNLDTSMQYYTLELDDESANACTIVTPFGIFKYRRMPMGLKCAPDFAQEVMEKILAWH